MIERLEHLAICAPDRVGDLALATPVLEAALAAAHIGRTSILVRDHLAPLMADGPLAAHVRAHGAREETQLLRELAPDAVLLLSNSFASAWRAWRAGVPLRMGSALSQRRWLLTHAVVPPAREGRRAPIPTAHLLRDVAGLAGITLDSLHPRLHVRAELRERQRATLRELGVDLARGYVVCCPGAVVGSAKLWPADRFAAVLDRLHDELGLRGVVSGAPGEEPLIGAVCAASRRGAISLGKTERNLEQLKALVAQARLLVVGDSGPRWVAAAFDVPCVTIMGPTLPELTATSLELAHVVRIDLECSPCMERVCPLGHHRCMSGIEPARVVAAAHRVLAQARAGASA
ncbi:MAG: glycosyltransferase family 9 protein [Planctomycetes bacterium]|nr:glycosyltransferase family 9 protein [Planctomycetota bacterium]